MLRHVRKFYTSPIRRNRIENSLHKVFGKYLLITNTVSSGVLIGIGDLIQQEIEYQKGTLPKRYDFQRNGRMVLVGLVQGPIFHYFYKFLDKLLPRQDLATIGKKILVDQFISSPVFIVSFFYGMGYLEKKTATECKDELKKNFFTLYATDWIVWPPTQFINFLYVAPQYRVLYINFVTMLYDVFLSYIKHRDDKPTVPLSI